MVSTIVVLAGALVAFIVLLAMPVRLDLHVERTGDTRVTWQLRALLGLVRVKSADDRATPERGRATRATGRRPRRQKKRRPTHIIAMLRTPGLLPRVRRFVTRLAGRVRWSRLHLHARVGLDDPADTGRLFAAVGPLVGQAAWQGWDVAIEPSFPDACLSGTCAATVSVRPLAVVATVVAFFGSPCVWRAVARLRRGR